MSSRLILKRQFSRALPRLNQTANGDDLLAKYYPSHLLKSIRLAQETIPDTALSETPLNYKFAPPNRINDNDDLTKLDPFWDYNPTIPNKHSSLPAQAYTYTPFNYLPPQIPTDTFPSEVKALASQEKLSKTLILANAIQKQTGINPNYITKTLRMKPLVLKRVSNQTAKGKIASFYALVAVGDGNGMIGLGEGKSRSDMAKSIYKAHWDAVRNVTFVPRYEDRTIFADIEYRYHGVKLFLRKKEPGFGLRCNHVIFEICQLLGIRDLGAKVYKSRNEMNIAKGVVEALSQKQKSLSEIALGRGKKIVDIRKVYYSE